LVIDVLVLLEINSFSAQYGRGKERKKTISERAQICIFIQGDKKKLELHRKQEVQC
jgi:hypothetical protein